MKNVLLLVFLFSVQVLTSQNEMALLTHKSEYSKPKLPKLVNTPYLVESFEIKNGLIIVQAKINGKLGNFIFDTGAPMLVLNQKPEKNLEKATSFQKDIYVGATNIKSFEWAGSVHQNIEAIQVDLSHMAQNMNLKIDGLIGYDIAKLYEIIIDYPSKQLIINHSNQNHLAEIHPPSHFIPFQYIAHVPTLQLEVNKQKWSFGLDTGAGINLLHKTDWKQLPKESYLHLAQEEIQGIDQEVHRKEVVRLSLSSEENYSFPASKYLITDLQFIRKTLDYSINGFLGYPFFKDQKFSIDYEKQRVYFW